MLETECGHCGRGHVLFGTEYFEALATGSCPYCGSKQSSKPFKAGACPSYILSESGQLIEL